MRLPAPLLAACLSFTLLTQVAHAAEPAAPPAGPPVAQAAAVAPAPPAADAAAQPAPPPPPAIAKSIVISLKQQSVTALENGVPVLTSPVTTGGPYMQTPIGNYSVLRKQTKFIMHSPWPEDDWRWYADSFVNYGLLFQSQGYYLHDAPWRGVYGPGSNLLVAPGTSQQGTHGCVNVPFEDEERIYFWADLGTPVIVQP